MTEPQRMQVEQVAAGRTAHDKAERDSKAATSGSAATRRERFTRTRREPGDGREGPPLASGRVRTDTGVAARGEAEPVVEQGARSRGREAAQGPALVNGRA